MMSNVVYVWASSCWRWVEHVKIFCMFYVYYCTHWWETHPKPWPKKYSSYSQRPFHSTRHVSRLRERNVPFHQLKLLPTRLLRSVTVIFYSAWTSFSENLLSFQETFAKSDKLNLEAVFQYTDTKRSKASRRPSTTPRLLRVAVSGFQLWDWFKCVYLNTGILTSQDCFSTFWAFRINKETIKVNILTHCWPLLLISHPREYVCFHVCVLVCDCVT